MLTCILKHGPFLSSKCRHTTLSARALIDMSQRKAIYGLNNIRKFNLSHRPRKILR